MCCNYREKIVYCAWYSTLRKNKTYLCAAKLKKNIFMSSYVIVGIILTILAIYLIRRGGIVRLIIGLLFGLCGGIFIIDDAPIKTVRNKVVEIFSFVSEKNEQLSLSFTETVEDTVLEEFNSVKEKITKATGRKPNGWFPDNEPTGINDGHYTYYTEEENPRDSILIIRDHKFVGCDGHYFPPDEEFESAKKLYNRSWVFDGDKVYVQDGPFDSIYIIRKNWWYKQHKEDYCL